VLQCPEFNEVTIWIRRQKSGSVLGAVLLIAGCCIGAGMLGVPVIAAVAGFQPSLGMFFVSWLFMATTALLLLEVNLWFVEDVSLVSMAGATLGKGGQFLAWSCFIFLFYALGVAYLAGSGELIAGFVQEMTGLSIPHWVGSALVSVLFAVFIYCGTYAVDLFNRALMLGLIVTYLLLVVLGIPHISSENLSFRDWSMAPYLLPVMIISFGFHNLIPSLKTYLGGNVARVRKAVIYGSFVPLIINIVWVWVIMGLTPLQQGEGLATVLDEGKMATETLREAVGSSLVLRVVEYFAFFAIVTSFLGNSLSFVDFLADGFRVKKDAIGKCLLCALVVTPPFIMALIYPNAFLWALNYAGAFGAVLLFGVLPALMVWSGRYRKGLKGTFQVPGGKITLLAVLAFALGMMLMQIMEKST